MINQRGVDMKRLIAVLVATVFGVSLFCPPLAAMDRDPTKPLPWIGNYKSPSGDDSPWIDVDKNTADHDIKLTQVQDWTVFLLRWEFGSSAISFLLNKESSTSDSRKNEQPPITDNLRGR
jgi:hypothetical protein